MKWLNAFACLTIFSIGASAAAVRNRELIAPEKEAKSEVSAALVEVNTVRASRGLRPFIEDRQLTKAAKQAAGIRAARLIAGHIPWGMGDFQCLPPGARADAAGCAAWPASMGWGSCCTFENYRYAGAAWVTGSDGQRYMHLFVRN